jgi:hypothetical protein
MPHDEQLKEANRAVGVRGSLLVSTEREILARAMRTSPRLRDHIGGLYQSIERAPKSIRGQMRARVGDSVRRYKTPVCPPEVAGEAAPG